MSGHAVSGKFRSSEPGLNRRDLLSGFALLPMLSSLLAVKNAAAQQVNSGFSFAVCGDSRPMMYLPVKDGRPDLEEGADLGIPTTSVPPLVTRKLPNPLLEASRHLASDLAPGPAAR